MQHDAKRRLWAAENVLGSLFDVLDPVGAFQEFGVLVCDGNSPDLRPR